MATPTEVAARLREYAEWIEDGTIEADRFLLFTDKIVGQAGHACGPEFNERVDRMLEAYKVKNHG